MGAEPRRAELEGALLEDEGRAALEEWLLFLLEPPEARALARRFALNIKGFRVEKAPARDVAAALARGILEQPRLRAEFLEGLADRLAGGPAPPAPAPAQAAAGGAGEPAREWEDLNTAFRESEARRGALEAEARALQARLEGARERTASAERRAEEAEGKVRQLAGQLRHLRELGQRAKEALRQERQRELTEEENERLRYDCAALNQQVKELEDRLQALEQERRKKPGKPPEPAPKEPALPGEGTGARIPFFAQEFLEALKGYPDAQIQRILHAVFLTCRNPAYSSLNIKKLEGKGEIWSVRAGISLRLFFLQEGKVLRFVMVADREDQDAVLHTLRERYA